MPAMTLLALLAATVAAGACRRAPAPVPEVVAVRTEVLPADPADPAWRRAPEHVAALLPQDLVEPRLAAPSTAEVRVRALSDGSALALRLEWTDPTADDLPGPGRFPDGCAIQFPQTAAVDAPDPQMGQQGRPVEIAYWRADWQATVDGRDDAIQSLYPNATVDHYPFEAPPLERGSDAQREMARRYAPADAVGNRRGGLRSSPVEDLIAEGPGTLAPAPRAVSSARGARLQGGWSVVIVRPVPDGLAERGRTVAAFALWQGSAGEAGSRKMRTDWVGLSLRDGP